MALINIAETQTENLVRRLRQWIGDTASSLFTNDNDLAQRLFDDFERPFLVTAGISVLLVDPTHLTDPLLTNPILTGAQRDLWALLVAKRVLINQLTEVARSAAQMSTPAGSMDTRQVPEALLAALTEVNAQLGELLGIDEAGLIFMDLTVFDGRVTQL